MTPLYESPRVSLWCADARDVLPGLSTESVDLALIDPPYGVQWCSNRRAERFDLLQGDMPADREGIREVLAHAVRLVGQNRHLYVFGPDDVLDGLKVSAPTTLVWNKLRHGAGNLRVPWGPQHEPISFTISKHRHAGDAGGPALPVRMRKGSVLSFSPPVGLNVRHPSEKPVALLRELLESSSRQGETVLDPFAGVGSTGVAAVLSGRRALLVEVDSAYCAIAVRRLRLAEQLADQTATA